MQNIRKKHCCDRKPKYEITESFNVYIDIFFPAIVSSFMSLMIETVRFLSGTVGLFSVMKSKAQFASTIPAMFFLTKVQEIDQ